jgi:hypothetical protein
MDFSAFLQALPAAATSPYAYAAYIVALGAWVVTIWLRGQPERKSQKILEGYKNDAARNTALAQLLGQAPPDNLPKKEILEWVRLKAAEKSRGYLLIGFLALLVTLIVIVVVALTTSRELPATPPASFAVVFAGDDGVDCLNLPGTVEVTVAADGALPQSKRIDGCRAQFAWAQDWRLGRYATVKVAGIDAFERVSPEQRYRLGEQEWKVALRPIATKPRLLVEIFEYQTPTPTPEDKRLAEQFHGLIREKIEVLADSLATRHPACKYLMDLRVAQATRKPAESPGQRIQEWRATNALLFLSGSLIRKESAYFVNSLPYFGDLAANDAPIRNLRLELSIDASELRKTTDSHSLAFLYAMAMDARRLKLPKDVVVIFLADANSIASQMDETIPGVRELKTAVQKALHDEQAGSPGD